MGFLLLLPFFFIRFGLLALLNKQAVGRAAYFAPLVEKEKPAYLLYQFSNGAILLYLFFLHISFSPAWLFYIGAAVFAAGTLLLIASIVNFASPAANGFNQNGLYRFSRNPMYVANFLFFLGCALLTRSLVLLGLVLVFQIAAHWIILSEERWCLEKFGEEYSAYMQRVRRYV